MARRNGSNKKAIDEGAVECVDDWDFVDDVDDPPSEVFRGFEKQSDTVVDSLNVDQSATPSPQNNRRRSILKKTQPPILCSFANSACSVSLLRDNLEELKDLFTKRPELYNTPMAGPDRGMNLMCKICKKVYSSEKKLQNHNENKHMIVYKPKTSKRVSFSDNIIVHEVKEYHRCRKCPRIFKDYKLLKSHMKDQHKKRKCYICNYCNKRFVDRMFFKVHIKLHCEVCGLFLKKKSKYIEHKRTVCRVFKLHTCKTCNISFFKFMDLKDHCYEHISTCYICDVCKDQCSTKCAIAHHIYFLHSRRLKRRNPNLYSTRKLGSESLYLCKFCDESSVEKDLIEKHVETLPDLTNRMMTGYKDYYFCDQCLKKFKKEKDMLEHKWTHFLKTPDNPQSWTHKVIEEDRGKKTVNNMNHTTQNSSDDDSLLKNLLTNESGIKRFYNLLHEKIPGNFQPRVVVEKMPIAEKPITDIAFVDVNSIESTNGVVSQKNHSDSQCNSTTRPTILQSLLTADPESHPTAYPQTHPTADTPPHPKTNPQLHPTTPQSNSTTDTQSSLKLVMNSGYIKAPNSRKILFSKFQCQLCQKYFANSFGLRRHKQTVHTEGHGERYRCSVCMEEFANAYDAIDLHRCDEYSSIERSFVPRTLTKDPDGTLENTAMETRVWLKLNNGLDVEDDYINFDICRPIVEITEVEGESTQVETDAPNSVKEIQNVKEIQRIYNVKEKLPEHFQPRVVLERLSVEKMLADYKAFEDAKKDGSLNDSIKKAPRRHTLISPHQCTHCGKYFSTNYCLNRHIEALHSCYDNLKCKVCEEEFVWPSLLQRHKCIRVHIPNEMPFEDARPEIHFDNIQNIQPFETLLDPGSHFDDLNIAESDNYMNSVDFEIPAPIVELTEYGNFSMNQVNGVNSVNTVNSVSDKTVQSFGYKVGHEVPIEF